MSASMAWFDEGLAHVWLPYTQMKMAPPPLPVVAARGSRLTLADGTELVDGVASWWTACHGIDHPAITAAIALQAGKLSHVMFGGLVHEPALTLASRLAAMLPGDLERVFFADSGSVAIEVALKMAVQFWLNQGQHGRTKFLAFRHGYHGDTLGAMSVCDLEHGMHRELRGYLPEHFVIDLPTNAEELEEFDAIVRDERHRLAAVILEPLVQGAGGMKVHEPEILASIRKSCATHDVLFIADEVMTGFGRTGSMFACEQAGVVPDIICLSKALTGGAIGLAATVATPRVFEAFLSDDRPKALMHGPTFMANPLACAAALASLDLFEAEPRMAQVTAIAHWLRQGLEPCRKFDRVVDVRVQGAIGVVQVDKLDHLDWLRHRFPEKGVYIRPFGDMIYLTPAFTISKAETETLTTAIAEVLREWAKL